MIGFWAGFKLIAGIVAATLAVSPSHSGQTGCFHVPSHCGYPDATNTGVPGGEALQPSGSITIETDGTTISNKRITGSVVVDASNVTIRNSSITPTGGGSGSYAVVLEEGADDFTLEHAEISGRRKSGTGLESAVWNHYNNPGARAVGSYLHGCADCWEGSGSFVGDYMVVDASYAGSHDENIYVCGGSVKVEHSTLINRHQQTATVFGDTSGCGGNRFVVTDSLLAGGGYVLYPQANSESPVGYTKVERNRFARCGTHSAYDRGSGGRECRGGPDQSGIFPQGGYYGLVAYYYSGPGQIWRENVWDDNLKLACLPGTC
jgi:hypothetical protein